MLSFETITSLKLRPFFGLLLPILDNGVPHPTYCVECYSQEDEHRSFYTAKYKKPHHLLKKINIKL